MPKPEWLKEKENKKERIYDICGNCEHFNGAHIKYIKYKKKENIEVCECKIHPGCRNIKYSIACDDYKYSMI